MSFVRVLAVALLLTAGVSVSAPVFAQTAKEDLRTPIITEVPIPVPDPLQVPGSEDRFKTAYLTSGRIEDLAQYIGIVYNFLISIVGMVAAVAMIIGGFQYLMSAGDSGRIGAAKTRMANALIGVVLALGAYTILNSINPRLLQLKLPDVRPVNTELSFLPWCEDVIKGDAANLVAPAAVTPITQSTGCGGIGEFERGTGKQICAYHGSCRIGKSSVHNLVTTCLQKSSLTAAKVREALTKDPNATFGHCTSCAEITEARSAQLGYSNLENACLAWHSVLNGIRAKDDPNQQLWSYCHKAGKFPSCVQADINCRSANDNEDNQNTGDCGTNDHDCGCEGYDEHPEPAYSVSDAKLEESVTVRKYETLETFPVHLAGVCGWNPCENYNDARHSTNPQAFKKGCKSDTGVTYRIQRVARFADLTGTDDCRNQ